LGGPVGNGNSSTNKLADPPLKIDLCIYFSTRSISCFSAIKPTLPRVWFELRGDGGQTRYYPLRRVASSVRSVGGL
jgi:hypothetical protein